MRLEDIAIATGIMLPFIGVYAIGVALKRCHDRREGVAKPEPWVQVAGEAAPGAFELVVALALVFGGLLKTESEGTAFQALGILASSLYLSLRGGYTYQTPLKIITNRDNRQPG